MARPGLRKHRKFKRLISLLGLPGPHVYGHLEYVWDAGYETGNPIVGDSTDVELLAEWNGEKGKLASALAEVGFLDLLPDGRYQIHDLYDHAPEYVQRRMDREAKRQLKGKSLSDVRREAAKSRWKDANGCKFPSLADRQDANGATPTPSPTPSPSFSLPDKPAKKKESKTSRPRDELFDAIVQVTGADPKLNGPNIGRICKLLRDADPPYTPAEVLTLPSAIARAGMQFTITVNAVGKFMYLVRKQPSAAKKVVDRKREQDEQAKRLSLENTVPIGKAIDIDALAKKVIRGTDPR